MGLSLRGFDPALDVNAGVDRLELCGVFGGDAARERFDAYVGVGVAEEGDRLAAVFHRGRPWHDAVGGGAEAAIAPAAHEVARVDHSGAGDGWGVDPVAFEILDLEAAFAVLKENGEGSVVSVSPGSELAFGDFFDGWVMEEAEGLDLAGVALVEVALGEVEAEGKGAHDSGGSVAGGVVEEAHKGFELGVGPELGAAGRL